MRGVVGRAASTSVFELDRCAPSEGAAPFVEHFWSVRWDQRGRGPFDSTVITFPCMHITHEWGDDGPRHGFPLPNTLVHGVVERIRDDGRLHRVEQVVQRSPWSMRTTQRVFLRYVCVPVKWVLCRYRLQQAALEIESDPGIDLADLAVRLGWYDQAHFINDFRSMLGSTPGEYAGVHGS